jgi:hypothetical protein
MNCRLVNQNEPHQLSRTKTVGRTSQHSVFILRRGLFLITRTWKSCGMQETNSFGKHNPNRINIRGTVVIEDTDLQNIYPVSLETGIRFEP